MNDKITAILNTEQYLQIADLVFQAEQRHDTEMTAPVADIKQLSNALQRAAWLEEEYEKFQHFVKSRQNDENWFYSGTALDQTMQLLNHYESERNAAANKLGAFVEHMVISLRALEMIVRQCYGLTHKQQSGRMDILLSTLQETLSNLLEDRSNGWFSMDTDPFSTKNWDFRRLVGENARLRAQVERLEKKQEESNA